MGIEDGKTTLGLVCFGILDHFRSINTFFFERVPTIKLLKSKLYIHVHAKIVYVIPALV